MKYNPNWPEINNYLEPGQQTQDWADLVARVFELKKRELIDDLVKVGVFGKTVAFLWVIEFQKRGLPHVHILIILGKEHKPTRVEQIDAIVMTDLPDDPIRKDFLKKKRNSCRY